MKAITEQTEQEYLRKCNCNKCREDWERATGQPPTMPPNLNAAKPLPDYDKRGVVTENGRAKGLPTYLF